MADGQLRSVIGQLRRIVGSKGGSSLTDAQLLEAYVRRQDEAAFEVLVWRHGTMVFNLCKRILSDAHEAEDAFQATFLVLVRKAGSIGKGEAVGSWLFKVACRVAYRTAAKSSKKPAEHPAVETVPAPNAEDDLIWRDIRPVLDEEINRLPERYRAPFVLCYLQGHTNEEAAELLGCPKGTILSRLARGRDRLRDRLTRRGLALSVGWLAVSLPQSASAASAPATLVSSTIQAAFPFAAGPAAGLASTSAAKLAEGVLHAMFLAKIKLVSAAVLAIAVLGLGAGSAAHWLRANPSAPNQPALQDFSQAAPVSVPQTSPSPQPATEPTEMDEPSFFDAREPDLIALQGRGGDNNPNAQSVAGKVASVSNDGKGFVVEVAVRGEEPKKVSITIGDKTRVIYNGVAPGGAVPTEGYTVVVSMEKDTAVSVTFHGAQTGVREADHTGVIAAVSKDGKSVTLKGPPSGRDRNDPGKTLELTLNDATQLIFSAVAKGGAKLAEGYRAQVWMVRGAKGNLVAKMNLLGTEPAIAERGDKGPDLQGRIGEVGKDGKSFILLNSGKNRGDEDIKVEVKLSDKTRILFNHIGPGAAKIVSGSGAGIWLEAGSKDTVEKLLVIGTVTERTPVITGKVVGVSKEANTITLEPAGRTRGEEGKQVTIKLTPQTSFAYFGVGPNGAQLGEGLQAVVHLMDGSKDTAAQVVLSKGAPAGRR